MGLFEVTRIKRSGATGSRIGVVKARNKAEAARFWRNKRKNKRS